MGRKNLDSIPYCVFIGVFCLADAFFSPYIVLYFTERGLSTAQASLAYSGMTIGAILGGLVLGYAADKTRNARATLCISMLVSALLVLCVEKCYGFAALAGCIFWFGFFDQPAVDLFDNLIVQNVGDWHRRYNLIHSFGNFGYVFGILIAGNVLSRFGYETVFGVTVVMLTVSAAACLKMGRAAGERRKRLRVPLKALFRNWLSFYIYFAMFLWGVIETGTLAYATKYYTDLGYTAEYAARMIAVAVLGQVLSYYYMYKRPDALPDRVLCSLGFGLLGLRILSMAVVRLLPEGVLLAMAFLGGACTPLTTLAVVHMIAQNYPAEISNSAQTFKSIAYRGIGGSLGSCLFGVLYGQLTPESLMLGAATVSAAAGLLLLPLHRLVTELDRRAGKG